MRLRVVSTLATLRGKPTCGESAKNDLTRALGLSRLAILNLKSTRNDLEAFNIMVAQSRRLKSNS